MAQRRVSQVDLCFDSMTDLITNLAGGLVLVVLLLLGLTQETRKVEAKAEFAAPKKTAAGGKSLRPLETQAVALRAEIARIEQDIKMLEETRLPELEKEVAELVRRAQKAGAKTK
jgi:hypothetical protein